MFELIFGLIWTVASVLCAVMMYGNHEMTIMINDEVVSRAEFNSLLWPKLFIGAFIVIGIVFLIIGLKKLMTNALTATVGTLAYGLIVDIYPSDCYVNDNPVLNADVLVVDKNDVLKLHTESIGLDYDKYNTGDFVQVKYYKNDVNIICLSHPKEIPEHIRIKLNDKYKSY